MTTKEKIIRQPIAAAEKEHGDILEILDATPLSGIIEVRKKAQVLLHEYEVGDPRLTEGIAELADEETRLFKIAEKQKDANALIGRRVSLEIEINDLQGELWHIERTKKARTL
jgi:hypothetical protein